MRSLTILLIALALLPLSIGLECKFMKKMSGFTGEQQKFNEDKEDKNGTSCEYHKQYCATYFGSSKEGVTWNEQGCGTYCGHGEGCIKQNRLKQIGPVKYAFMGHECCCKGDMCTPPAPPKLPPHKKPKSSVVAAPTLLLPLAAAAAVLAA